MTSYLYTSLFKAAAAAAALVLAFSCGKDNNGGGDAPSETSRLSVLMPALTDMSMAVTKLTHNIEGAVNVYEFTYDEGRLASYTAQAEDETYKYTLSWDKDGFSVQVREESGWLHNPDVYTFGEDEITYEHDHSISRFPTAYDGAYILSTTYPSDVKNEYTWANGNLVEIETAKGYAEEYTYLDKKAEWDGIGLIQSLFGWPNYGVNFYPVRNLPATRDVDYKDTKVAYKYEYELDSKGRITRLEYTFQSGDSEPETETVELEYGL